MDIIPIRNQIKIALPIGVLLILWCIEGWRPFFSRGRGNRLQHAGRNLAIAVFNVVFIGLTFSSLIVLVATWSEDKRIGLLHVFDWPAWLETAVVFLLFDGWMYLWHRANHAVPFLWQFHRMHHTDREMDVTTATRFHTGELVLSSVLRLAMVPLVGLSPWHIFIYEILLLPVIQFHHSNVNLPERWDRWLRTLIVSPNMHRVHHSSFQSETDSNFSSILSFWDRLGATRRQRADTSAIRFGLGECSDSEWQTVWGMLKACVLVPSRISLSQNTLRFSTQDNAICASTRREVDPRRVRSCPSIHKQ